MNSERKTISIILVFLILTGFSGFQFGPFPQDASAQNFTRIVGYFPYWESGDVSSIDYSKLTDIIYFHIWPNSNGTLETSVVNYNDLNTIRDNAHKSGVRVLIAVGGGEFSDEFPIMASNDVARSNFVNNVADFILDNNLDGVNLDWETPINQQKIDYQGILLEDLASKLHPLKKFVTIAVNGEVVELKESSAMNVDWINVMAYDMHWGSAEHSTFIDSKNAIESYESIGIPKEKLSLGITFYGRDNSANGIKYEEIVALCSPLPSENYCDNYFFNGIDLVKQKTQYVLDSGYGGIIVWNLGQDTYDKTSLLTAINEIISNESRSKLLLDSGFANTSEVFLVGLANWENLIK